MGRKILIINYGLGNIRSIQNKFNRMDVECSISSDKRDIERAERLILPGVGHFKKAMDNLRLLDIIDVLNKKVLEENIPILGICLGAQLFCKYSEEGNCEGLGWIDAEVVRFKVSDTIRYKIPHMGWNDVSIVNRNKLDEVIRTEDKFYFVHSYYIKCKVASDVWMTTVYDYEFVSAVHRDNIYGVQFHPEKSHDVGFELLKKFVEL